MATVQRSIARVPPLVRFAVLSAMAMGVLAVAVVSSLDAAARDRAAGRLEAGVAARLAAARLGVPASLANGLTADRRAAIETALSRMAGRSLGPVRVLSREDRTVASAGGRFGGSATQTRGARKRALSGRVTSVALDGGDVAVFVPLRGSPTGRVAGLLEARAPASPGAAPGGSSLAGVLGALALAWLALVAGAALLLRRRGDWIGGDGSSPHLDALTGLPTRVTFRGLLERAMLARRRTNGGVAVLFIDLNRFKEVNDTLGHFNGDLLLKRIAPRLRSAVRDDDTLARLGGDEFGVLIPDLAGREAAAAAAERVIASFDEPFVLGGIALTLDASIGIALYPGDGERVDILIHRADTAMYAAKASGSGYAFYSDEQEQGSRRRLALAGELRRAISDGEIVIHYQPKTRLADGQIVGAEALARWEHPKLGLILPGEFVPLAEQTNQLGMLTEGIVEVALGQARAWRGEGFDLSVAVNLSVRNLLDASLVDRIPRLLRRCGAEPAWLEFELTESMLMSDPQRALEVLRRLKEIGIGLSVDDFGTGYSSLAYLKDLPVDAIKIDKSFVLDMEEDPRSAAIVQSTIDLGRNLGLSVVAEGVETHQALKHLASLGCDLAQGYLIARPMPAGDLLERLRQLRRLRELDRERDHQCERADATSSRATGATVNGMPVGVDERSADRAARPGRMVPQGTSKVCR